MTLIELLVSAFIFSLVVGAVIGIFVTALETQRKILARQEILSQVGYALEYMSKSLRMAKKDIANPPFCLDSTGSNYETNPSNDEITFIDYHGQCVTFSISGGKIMKESDSGTPEELTSGKIFINQFKINLSGQEQTDNLQPSVTIFLDASSTRDSSVGIKIQTTVSQRDLDETF